MGTLRHVSRCANRVRRDVSALGRGSRLTAPCVRADAGPAGATARRPGSTSDSGVLEEVIVTAQKRTENLQDVPLSIQASAPRSSKQLNVKGFDDYVKFLPSVSYQSRSGPGFAQVYMRGVASGGNGNHSGSLPSVGMYLDEQPITTIQGALDIHIYDIARVEALAGPQGTLYGASSQAGTIRIITNKPDPTGFTAGYDLEGNTIDDGGNGYLVRGLRQHAARRQRGGPPGRLDSSTTPATSTTSSGTRTFPTSGVTIGQRSTPGRRTTTTTPTPTAPAPRCKSTSTTTGRITPQLMAQEQKSNGTFGFDPTVGDLKVAHCFPEHSDDRWYQAALTVEGKIGNFDLTYAGALPQAQGRHAVGLLRLLVLVRRAYYALHDAAPDSYGLFGTYFYDDDAATHRILAVHPGQGRYRR